MAGIYDELMRIYDSIAYGYSSFRIRAWDVIKELSAQDGWVVDVGCGPCHNGLAYILKSRSKLVCVDLSQEMLKIARGLTLRFSEDLPHRVDVVQADMRYLPIRSGSIGAVMYVASINHIRPEHLSAVLSECLRVLRAGGEGLITMWALTHPTVLKRLLRNLLDLMLMRRRPHQLMDIYVPWRSRRGTHLRYYHIYRLSHITKLLKSLGFRIVKSGRYNPHRKLLPENYFVVLRKYLHHIW